MATQKTSKKDKTETTKKEIKWIQNIRSTIKNETVQFITGLFCVMIALYMILAFSSFILNGGADQSVMEQNDIAEWRIGKELSCFYFICEKALIILPAGKTDNVVIGICGLNERHTLLFTSSGTTDHLSKH